MRFAGKATVILALLSSCSTTVPVIVKATLVETSSLRQQCADIGVGGAEVVRADSLAQVAVALNEKGEGLAAYWISECAAAYYDLAIQKADLVQSQRAVEGLKGELARARKELDTYREVLKGLENMRNP